MNNSIEKMLNYDDPEIQELLDHRKCTLYFYEIYVENKNTSL